MNEAVEIRRLMKPTDAEVQNLADVLIDCVDGGASVSFMRPLPLAKAAAYWRGVAAQLHDGRRALFTAEDAQGILGTVQLVFDLPENQPLRHDVFLPQARAAPGLIKRRRNGPRSETPPLDGQPLRNTPASCDWHAP